jgi:23S rRNA pseudouridine955/2504/2580 synthase
LVDCSTEKSTTYLSLVKPIVAPKAARGEARPQVRLIQVDSESDGQRLDNFLLREIKGVPKTLVYRIIRSGEVRLDKARAAADTRVLAGQMVRVPPLRLPSSSTSAACGVAPERGLGATAATAPPREFAVLHEDEQLLAIDKPAGVAVHGGSGVSFGVIEQLRRARPQARYLELVHRLDKETSGVLLLAKKRSALTALQEQFKTRQTHKVYLALAAGEWPASVKVIDLPLHKFVGTDGERHVKTVPADARHEDGTPMGKRAITLVKRRKTVKLRGGRVGGLS